MANGQVSEGPPFASSNQSCAVRWGGDAACANVRSLKFATAGNQEDPPSPLLPYMGCKNHPKMGGSCSSRSLTLPTRPTICARTVCRGRSAVTGNCFPNLWLWTSASRRISECSPKRLLGCKAFTAFAHLPQWPRLWTRSWPSPSVWSIVSGPYARNALIFDLSWQVEYFMCSFQVWEQDSNNCQPAIRSLCLFVALSLDFIRLWLCLAQSLT